MNSLLTNRVSETQPHTTHLVSADTLSQSAVAFLQSKLKTCLKSHVLCQNEIDERIPGYPVRLLSVNNRLRSKVQLVDTGSDTQGDYFTLSHCWGGLQPLQLTHGSEQALRDGVRISTLPKTFRDAINICRRLDVGYLWIDSLCIFQDDLADWHAQAASMGRVYASASCNIAATGAINGSYGLRFTRNLKAVKPFHVIAPGRFWLGGDEQPSVQYIVCPSGYDDDIRYSPLNKRAWVLQERFLSRRIMHFTRSGVFWECLADLSNDIYPDGLPPDTMDFAAADERLKRLLLPSGCTGGDQKHWTAELYEGWSTLCDKYSQCSLSMESDKLVALAGIAQEVALRTGDTFVCGLWRRHFLSQLLWVHEDHRGSVRLVRDWRAPTWSWAAHDANFEHSTHLGCGESRERCVVEEVNVDALPSGKARGASIVLHGFVVHAILSVRKYDHGYTKDVGLVYERSGEVHHGVKHLFFDRDDSRLSSFQEHVVCIAIYEDRCKKQLRLTHGTRDRFGELGVLVLRKSSSDPDQYERIGVFLLDEDSCKIYTANESPDEHSITII